MQSVSALLGADELQVVMAEDLADLQHNFDLDGELGAQVARGASPALARIWRAGAAPGIAVSRRDLATPRAQAAAEGLRAQGWQVLVRQTGGTAVPQCDGVLHFSLILPRTPQSGTTDAYYRLLCGTLIGWLAEYGIRAITGSLPGAYCDGQYNVLAAGRKLIGTAQSWRGGLAGVTSGHPGYIVAHACIMIDVDFAWATQLINQFYEAAGHRDRVDEQSSVCLRQLLADAGDGTLARTPAEQTFAAARQLAEYVKQHFARLGVRCG